MTLHAQIFLGEKSPEASGHGGIARNLEASAPIDGGAQIIQEGDTVRTTVHVRFDLHVGRGTQLSIEVVGQRGE